VGGRRTTTATNISLHLLPLFGHSGTAFLLVDVGDDQEAKEATTKRRKMATAASTASTPSASAKATWMHMAIRKGKREKVIFPPSFLPPPPRRPTAVPTEPSINMDGSEEGGAQRRRRCLSFFPLFRVSLEKRRLPFLLKKRGVS
jgi:hypothetical protein